MFYSLGSCCQESWVWDEFVSLTFFTIRLMRKIEHTGILEEDKKKLKNVHYTTDCIYDCIHPYLKRSKFNHNFNRWRSASLQAKNKRFRLLYQFSLFSNSDHVYGMSISKNPNWRIHQTIRSLLTQHIGNLLGIARGFCYYIHVSVCKLSWNLCIEYKPQIPVNENKGMKKRKNPPTRLFQSFKR